MTIREDIQFELNSALEFGDSDRAERMQRIMDWFTGKACRESPASQAMTQRDINSEVIGPNPITNTIRWGKRVFHITETKDGFEATDGHYLFQGKTYAELRKDAVRKLSAVARLRDEYGMEP